MNPHRGGNSPPAGRSGLDTRADGKVVALLAATLQLVRSEERQLKSMIIWMPSRRDDTATLTQCQPRMLFFLVLNGERHRAYTNRMVQYALSALED